MSRGIVMEQHKRYMIVMTRDGSFQKVQPIDSEIGVEVEFEPFTANSWLGVFSMKGKPFSIKVVAMACVLALLMIPILSLVNQEKAYAYIDIDINPSVELKINKDLRVSSIIPINEDAAKIVQELEHIKGKKIETAIELVIHQAESTGFYNIHKNVLVGINYVKENDDTSLHEIIDGYFSEDPDFDWKVVTMQVPTEIRDTARELKQSMNQVLADTIEEDESSEQLEDIHETVSTDEKAIIQSFYEEKDEAIVIEEKSDEEDVNQATDSSKEVENAEEKHPIELKGKNGDINSEGKNRNKNSNKSKANENGKHKDKKDQSDRKSKNSNHKGKGDEKGKGKDKKDHNKHKNKNNKDNKHHNKSKNNKHNKGHGSNKEKGKGPHH